MHNGKLQLNNECDCELELTTRNTHRTEEAGGKKKSRSRLYSSFLSPSTLTPFGINPDAKCPNLSESNCKPKKLNQLTNTRTQMLYTKHDVASGALITRSLSTLLDICIEAAEQDYELNLADDQTTVMIHLHGCMDAMIYCRQQPATINYRPFRPFKETE